MPGVRYVLWDFGDTLVDQRWMWANPEGRLCEIALERLGGHDPAEGLLIDNIEANVEAWRALGGQAYLFRDDIEFARDFGSMLA